MDRNGFRQRSLTIGGLTLSLLPAAPYCARYTPSQPVAGFAFESQEGVHAFASDRVRPFHAAANGLAFTPAGCSVYSEAHRGGEYLTLSGDPGALSALLAEEEMTLPEDRFTGRVDPRGVRAAHTLRRFLLAGHAEPTAIEAPAAEFIQVISERGHKSWRAPPAARSLTRRRFRIVEELIEAHLSESLSIGDMARACGLSTGFFIRAFKSATGQTPHRFLMERRIAYARQLLMHGESSVGDIAHMAGFSSHAHMTTRFRLVLGVLPSTYQQMKRN